MAVGLRSGGNVPQSHKIAEDVPHIVIVIENQDPIDLLDFTASLTALAREHEATMRATRPGIDVDETRLLIVDVRKGSIVLELLPALAPLVATVEYANTAIEFVKHIAGAVTVLGRPGGRLENATTQQLKNMNDMVHSVVKDTNVSLQIAVKHTNGEVIQEIVVKKEDGRHIVENARAQRLELEGKGSASHQRVLMHLHQSSVENLKVGKKTSEKGIVESLDPIPRTLIYASDLAGQRIKDAILEPGGNPYQKGFVVDLDVETIGGRPRVYRVLAVHDVIDLED